MPRFCFGCAGIPARQFDHAGRAGGVVVGAGVNRAGQAGRQRVLFAESQMIVMRADDDVFVGLAGQVARPRCARS